MFVERLVFQAKYGQGDTLVELFREMSKGFGAQNGLAPTRLYTDAAGPMFTINVEIEYADLEAYAAANRAESGLYSTPEFRDWFGRMQAVVERGERHLFNVESLAAK
ncbi:MAG: hypothetical protein ACRDG3_09280 [Tepidiformaceae bacterium]